MLDRTAHLGLPPADYIQRHILPQETVIGQVSRSGLRLLSYDADFSGPPGESHSYFVVFEKPR